MGRSSTYTWRVAHNINGQDRHSDTAALNYAPSPLTAAEVIHHEWQLLSLLLWIDTGLVLAR